MSVHTSGPWTVREPNGPGMGLEIREIGAWFGRNASSDETRCNAALCAAAPSILDELTALRELNRELVDMLDVTADRLERAGFTASKARAIIAKARGEK